MTALIVSALLALGPSAAKADKPRTVELSVTDKGFEPNNITVKKGEPLHLVVTRKTDHTCATSIDIKDAGIRKDLPLNQAVAIDPLCLRDGNDGRRAARAMTRALRADSAARARAEHACGRELRSARLRESRASSRRRWQPKNLPRRPEATRTERRR